MIERGRNLCTNNRWRLLYIDTWIAHLVQVGVLAHPNVRGGDVGIGHSKDLVKPLVGAYLWNKITQQNTVRTERPWVVALSSRDCPAAAGGGGCGMDIIRKVIFPFFSTGGWVERRGLCFTQLPVDVWDD